VPVCAIDPQAWDGVLMNTTGVAHSVQALELTSNNLDGVLPEALGDLGGAPSLAPPVPDWVDQRRTRTLGFERCR
jgi:hypothetical protein